jgi:hypothetical protein
VPYCDRHGSDNVGCCWWWISAMRSEVRGTMMELQKQARQAHNRHFRRVSPTPAARNHLTTNSVFDPRPRSANKVRTRSQTRSLARIHHRRILRAIQLTHRPQQLLLPTHPSFSTANMDQAKLARMQASVRIGMLPQSPGLSDVYTGSAK